MMNRVSTKLVLLLFLALSLHAELNEAAGPVCRLPINHHGLNPELIHLLPHLEQRQQNTQLLTEKTLAATRALSIDASLPKSGPPVEQLIIPGPSDNPRLTLYLVNAHPGGDAPAVLLIHGGGFVSGTGLYALPSAQRLAESQNCVVAVVEYRLAPETKFPGALEDNYSALVWLYSQAERIGVDRNRIAVLGESAGGGHAAMLAIAARDRGAIPIKLLVLLSPMLDDRTSVRLRSNPDMGRYVWTRQENYFGWTSLLGVPAGAHSVPKGSVPARLKDLRGLPATYIAVGSIDLFADEDLAFAQRLMDAGIATEFHLFPGGFHGFQYFAPDAKISKDYENYFNSALIRAFSGGLKSP